MTIPVYLLPVSINAHENPNTLVYLLIYLLLRESYTLTSFKIPLKTEVQLTHFIHYCVLSQFNTF